MPAEVPYVTLWPPRSSTTSRAEIVNAVPVTLRSFVRTYVAPSVVSAAGPESWIAFPGIVGATSGTRHETA